MADDYPYMVSNNKIEPIIESIANAERPPKFTNEFLKKLGYSSSNDRAIIPLFKRLGVLGDSGQPTDAYARLQVRSEAPAVLAECIRDLYSDLFAINTNINQESDENIKGAFSRITGKDARTVARYTATFKALCKIADFKVTSPPKKKTVTEREDTSSEEQSPTKEQNGATDESISPQFHYNIQIHLPPTTDVAVYNAIFKSLREHILK